MKGRWIIPPVVILAILVLGMTAKAETRYVTDQLVLTLRQKPAGDSKILTTLPTGTPLEVLGSSGEYLRVRTQEGDEGYILERYLTADIPKPEIIARLEKEKERLAAELEKSEAARRELDQMRQTRQETERGHLQEKSALAAEVEALRKERKEMLTAVGIKWFMAGAGVLAVGFLFGRASHPKRRGGLYS